MARKKRRTPRYRQTENSQAQAEREATRIAADMAARSQELYSERIQGGREAAERKRWAAVDPSHRLRVVKPFGPSQHQQLDQNAINRFLEIKADVLGYTECVILEPDDDSYSCSRGHLGSVASQADAEKLIAAILQEYPNVQFRIELEPYLLSNVVWTSLEDFLDGQSRA